MTGSPYNINRLTYRHYIRKQVIADYHEMIAKGMEPKLAEMLALQQAPSLQTDTRWLTGEVNGKQFASFPKAGELYQREARRAGVITDGAVYKHQLARYPGDPEAWVRSRADVKAICERRNWDCEGSVKHKAVDDGTPDSFDLPYEVAPDIVENAILSEVEDNHDITADDIPQLREDLTKRLSGHADD
jgi:hypothetical protein